MNPVLIRHGGTFNVFINSTALEKISTLSGEQDLFWSLLSIQVNISTSFRILLEGIIGNSSHGIIAIDDISYSDTLCRQATSTTTTTSIKPDASATTTTSTTSINPDSSTSTTASTTTTTSIMSDFSTSTTLSTPFNCSQNTCENGGTCIYTTTEDIVCSCRCQCGPLHTGNKCETLINVESNQKCKNITTSLI